MVGMAHHYNRVHPLKPEKIVPDDVIEQVQLQLEKIQHILQDDDKNYNLGAYCTPKMTCQPSGSTKMVTNKPGGFGRC